MPLPTRQGSPGSRNDPPRPKIEARAIMFPPKTHPPQQPDQDDQEVAARGVICVLAMSSNGFHRPKPRGRQRRDRPRAGRLVLVSGRRHGRLTGQGPRPDTDDEAGAGPAPSRPVRAVPRTPWSVPRTPWSVCAPRRQRRSCSLRCACSTLTPPTHHKIVRQAHRQVAETPLAGPSPRQVR